MSGHGRTLWACVFLAAATAAAAAEAPAPAPPVESLIARLSHEEWAERDTALKALVAMGEPAVPALAAFAAGATDPDASLRARDALRQIGWPALVHLLGRGDASPRLAEAREACVRAFLEGTIAKRSLEDNVWVEGPAPDADVSRLEGIWETGSGHGFSLRLYRFRWEGEALRLDRLALQMDRRPYTGPNPPEDSAATVETASVPAATTRAALALALRASAIRLEPKPGDKDPAITRLTRAWGSTGDFHSRVRLEEAGRVVYANQYTGYPGSSHEKEYVAVDACSVVFATAFKGVAWSERPAGEADLAFLLERTGGYGQDAWWVRERLLGIVWALGDRRFEPFLRKVIGLPLEEVTRQQYRAINAYARITGVDLRTKPAEAMDVAAVREAYLRRFAESPPGPGPR
jgi:hypothetical protein